MPSDHSVVLVVPDASKANVSKVLAAMWGDDPPGTAEFSVMLSASGAVPATHWALHLMQSAEQAAALTAMPTGGGVVPASLAAPLSDYGISEADAQAACLSVSCVSDMTGDVVPGNHLDIVCEGLGLQRAVDNSGPVR